MRRLVSLKKDGFKSIPKSILVVCLIIFLLVIVGAIAWKPLRVFNLQARAGEIIEIYIQSYASDYDSFFTCQIPELTVLPENEKLKTAITMLEKARKLAPENSQTYLLLGRAYCLTKDFKSAMVSFESFNQERPNNPLGYLEKGFAYYNLVNDDDLQEVNQQMQKTEIRENFESLGYSFEYFLDEGEDAFINRDYKRAWIAYRLANVLGLLEGNLVSRTDLLEAVFNDSEKQFEDYGELLHLFPSTPLVISPKDFIHLSDADPIKTRIESGRLAGIYTTNDEVGGVFILVEKSGTYCINVLAFDKPPKPTKVELSFNFTPLMMIQLTKGDKSWKAFEDELFLEQGKYFLNLRLTNYAQINGVERNGVIGDIEIKLCN